MQETLSKMSFIKIVIHKLVYLAADIIAFLIGLLNRVYLQYLKAFG